MINLLDFSLSLTKLRVERGDFADIRFVLITESLVALAKEFGGVDRLEKFGMLSRGSDRVASLLTFFGESLASFVESSFGVFELLA